MFSSLMLHINIEELPKAGELQSASVRGSFPSGALYCLKGEINEVINCNGQQPFLFVVLLQPALKWVLASQCMLDLYNSALQL